MSNEQETKQNPFNEALDHLILTVETRVSREVTTFIRDYINERIDTIQGEKHETEYDYCEQEGRLKELRELLTTLRNLK
jgi:hypothetical protein